jgi:hypothetical protein
MNVKFIAVAISLLCVSEAYLQGITVSEMWIAAVG